MIVLGNVFEKNFSFFLCVMVIYVDFNVVETVETW